MIIIGKTIIYFWSSQVYVCERLEKITCSKGKKFIEFQKETMIEMFNRYIFSQIIMYFQFSKVQKHIN